MSDIHEAKALVVMTNQHATRKQVRSVKVQE